MAQQDTSETREKIISAIKTKGPSLPAHISSATGTSMLFASAFLSELLSEKRLKITNMKVGTSPIYFLEGQETQLEPYAEQYLKSKEKETFLLLKEKKLLKDSEQEPSTRVALRALKDFAIPVEKNNELYWRYFLSSEEPSEKTSQEKSKETNEQETKELGILDKNKSSEKSQKEETKKSTEKKTKKKTKKKTTKKQDNKFFNKVKEFLQNKNIEILDIESFSKTDLALRIKEESQEKILIAYNKKRISEEDLTKAYKKAQEENLPYVILSLGEPSKKLTNLIQTIKKMEKIETIS